ncbi:deoxyribose-phosphate aldolase [Candidatus Uabimicrobium amorphum]|uniref:Deoxyribose-phosphate aldolase n=1 Tax=Uabimicrobium amorphum TaxID=2596890 RepID=A0A5S9F5A1_UABAM|nr:deoxyribose-phosphate aldolase [Candidatus Uabimicrobium amorphum]BBM85449.1 deoxyribose-phosphate aldolase [Candidatus Uabimicrobium amorphum]
MDTQELIKVITEEVVQSLNTKCPIGEKCGGCAGEFHCASQRPDDVQNLINVGASRVGAGLGIPDVGRSLAKYIDHTLLKPEATPQEIKKICDEALQYNFASVCIQPSYVGLAADLLRGSSVKVCTVIGFPLGSTSSAVKAYEAQLAEKEGAHEIDMVIHVGALKSGGYDYVEEDIRSVVKSVSQGTIVKVILETALLDDNQKIKACELAKKAGADFVKTSTGFSKGGATASDIALMRRVVGNSMGVKASGGVRNQQAAQLMIRMGASRIGASASVKIVDDSTSGSTSGY